MSILLSIATLLTIALYLGAWKVALRESGVPAGPPPAERSSAASARAPTLPLALLAGLCCHGLALGVAVLSGAGFRFGFAQALSGTFWVGIALLAFESRSGRLDSLRVLILPVAVLAGALPLFFPGTEFIGRREQPLLLPHLLAGTFAYGVLLLAAVHAALMMVAARALHRAAAPDTPLARWAERLPPLLTLERILFRFIGIGFGLLTITALSGILFSEAVFGQPLRFDHKTVFTLVSWAMFGVLLVGRRLHGWRARTALRLTLAGFGLLLLGYVGSRFVIEVVLQRG